jgi:hypothetical protein
MTAKVIPLVDQRTASRVPVIPAHALRVYSDLTRMTAFGCGLNRLLPVTTGCFGSVPVTH